MGTTASDAAAGGAAGRHSDVVERLLTRAARRGERVVNWTRVVLCGALIVRLVAVAPDEYRDGVLRTWIDTGTLLTGIAISVALLAALRRKDSNVHAISIASVAVDAVLILAILITGVLWPSPDYTGAARGIAASVFFIAAVAVGVRLSPSVAAFGIACNAAALAIVLALDRVLLAERVPGGVADLLMVAILLGASAMLGWLFAQRTRRLVYDAGAAMLDAERMRQRLGAYVSEELAEQLIYESQIRLGGHRQQIAVLFSDLRGFTRYAERLPPERLVAELNAYLDVMVAAIRAEGGVVDKYIGDAIMVVFGVPAPRPDDAVRAIRSAAAMQKALVEHNRQRVGRGLPPLQQGIGVHYGPAIAGNIGTAERLQFTVVGDTVNLASRLESSTKEQGVEVLLSAEVVAAARALPGAELPPIREHGRLTVRGREADLEVFTLEAKGAAAAAG